MAVSLIPLQYSAGVAARRRPASTIGVLLAAVLLALTALLAGGGAADAHDELVGTEPAADSTVEVLPPSIELTYSNIPSGIGAQVQVLDDAGTDWAEGPVEFVNRTASQAIRTDAPAGEYTVNWRVVSSDSHPIEGTFTLTAQQGSTTAPDTLGTGSAVDAEEPMADAEPTAGVSDFPWSIVVMIGVLVVIVVVLALTARRRLGSRQ